MPPLDQPQEAMVPIWAVTLTAQVAEIKAKTDAIPDVQRELEGLKAAMVPMSEHQRLMARVDTLWDAYQATQGELKARSRSETLWRLGFGVAYAVLTLWVAAHQAGIHFTI